MENTDGQRKLTSLPEASDDNEQQGANHGDDRERQSKTTKTPEEPGDEPEALREMKESMVCFKVCILPLSDLGEPVGSFIGT